MPVPLDRFVGETTNRLKHGIRTQSFGFSITAPGACVL